MEILIYFLRQFVGNDDWLAATKEAFKSHCIIEAKRYANLTEGKSNETSSSVLDSLLESACLNDCSGAGSCIQGKYSFVFFYHG